MSLEDEGLIEAEDGELEEGEEEAEEGEEQSPPASRHKPHNENYHQHGSPRGTKVTDTNSTSALRDIETSCGNDVKDGNKDLGRSKRSPKQFFPDGWS